VAATGFVSGTQYQIWWYKPADVQTPGQIPATAVSLGSPTGGSDGNGTATVTVPSTATAGTYRVDLATFAQPINSVLIAPPLFTVGVVAPTGSAGDAANKIIAGGSGYVQGWDTDASKVDLTTGRPLLTFTGSGAYKVMTGGPAVHNAIKYYMDNAPSGANQSPAFFRTQTLDGTLYYQLVLRATSPVIVSVPASDVAGLQKDLCLVQSFTDLSGRIVFIITGLNAPGTQAGALWFVKVVMANPSAYANSVYVIGSNDTTTPWQPSTDRYRASWMVGVFIRGSRGHFRRRRVLAIEELRRGIVRALTIGKRGREKTGS